MTPGKATLLTVGLVGAVAIVVAVGQSMNHREGAAPESTMTASAPETPIAAERATEPTPVRRAPSAMAAALSTVPPTQPDLQQRLKPLLNRGTNMDSAAEGFRNGHQFATVAHASHNTQVPFVVMKHRVLNEGRTLESVIREFKPELDARAEAGRARDEAAQDFAFPK